jgi:glycosyltransferase involved in cell wall biosynthesis
MSRFEAERCGQEAQHQRPGVAQEDLLGRKARRPVIATAIAIHSLPEIVLARETGYLVLGIFEGLSEALVELACYEVLRRRLGDQAREGAWMVFPLETSTDRTLNVYREVT